MSIEKDNVLSEAIQRNQETADKLASMVKPALDQQQRLKQLATVKIPTVPVELTESPITKAMETFRDSSIVRNLGEIAIASKVPDFQFTSPALQSIKEIGKAALINISSALTAFVNSEAVQMATQIQSAIGSWLQSIDFSPLQEIVDNLSKIGLTHDYRKLNELYLKAMFEARWFPYAGWIADVELFGEVNQILSTSRASKNRIKRIDKALFAYYSKTEMMNIKRNWRKCNLPNYMIRIMIQAIQAFNRKEYALTVSSLSTLWEGIIAEKSNYNGYRVSSNTRQNLQKLITENEYAPVFSSFCNEFIFYDCHGKEDVKPDVPGRHGIAHCWYDTYPNRKAALNAILFTDFLIDLKPLEKQEEKANG